MNKYIRDSIIRATYDALSSIDAERYFHTERGYQGELNVELNSRIAPIKTSIPGVILELEHQKGVRHGTSQRPDIIFHVPEMRENGDVTSGNLAVWALKLKASRRSAVEDFNKLDEMFDKLAYGVGFFINVGSDRCLDEAYQGRYRDRVVCFSVKLCENVPVVKKVDLSLE